MPTNKRLSDLTDYTSVLPYASELFGVYQPMIGWRSGKKLRRYTVAMLENRRGLLAAFAANYAGKADVAFSKTECVATITNIEIGRLAGSRLLEHDSSVLMQSIASILPKDRPPEPDGWRDFVNADLLRQMLDSTVATFYADAYKEQCRQLHAASTAITNRTMGMGEGAHAFADLQSAESRLVADMHESILRESALACALLALTKQQLSAQLESLFYIKPSVTPATANAEIVQLLNVDDPFATFDPKKDIKNVSLSPLGIVHLFRQYFFELDTFLGTPTGHVWLSPGSTVELIEVSTRRVYTEQVTERSLDTTRKTETSLTDREEIATAVKEDNKKDLKLGASLTVNQSWGTGSATATGSLNMDTTQGRAREETHKHMREQTSKLTTEIKENFKSTFKIVTENTDMSSKRYVLSNDSKTLVNYEMRRKMRQVGVQVQDIGTYLCWEAFVDEPGRELGLANLVNISKPADLAAPPDQGEILLPPDVPVPFTANLVWNFNNNNRRFNGPDGFLVLNNGVNVPPGPEGFEVKYPDGLIDVFQVSGTGEDFSGVWAFKGKLLGTSLMSMGPYIGPGGMRWDETINFVVGGVVMFTPNAAKRKEIADANAARVKAGQTVTAENERKTRSAFVTAAKERIELASNIGTRKYEDLREEERIIVYRKLIGTLMSDVLYKMPESTSNDITRHVVSELINSIFDVDKMLYFVAPEWWKPRKHYHQYLANGTNDAIFTGNLTNWSDLEARTDNYYITEKSRYARLGSSLGWLLQLDGDDLRNAFLNAPWVKAVIPIRPGKELQASNWLQQMHIEGTDGLDDLYQAPAEELQRIKTELGVAQVTLADAIRFLCLEVAAKYQKSLKVGKYPKDEINDDNTVSATPIDKVYEHGFYPLKGGFRAVTSEPYEVFDQWIEVLPTDQVVPVEVTYDPRTGRQLAPPV
ncbi:MAG: peptidoglycan-binding protein [Gemmatimonadaceae bacterium]